MKLRTIKNKMNGNIDFTLMIERIMALIKQECSIDSNAVMYFLGYYQRKQLFLCKGKIYVVSVRISLDEKHNPIISSLELDELYKITMNKEYPKTLKDIAFRSIKISTPIDNFTPNDFFDWIDCLSELNIEIDWPYYEVIKFLNSYSKDTFRTDRYLFYSKWDGDPNFFTNIYAYDLKHKCEMKLYIPDKTVQIGEKWKFVAPEKLSDIVVEDFTGKISAYLKRECKSAFLEYSNEINPKYGVKYYWLMELVKRAVQPIDELHEWDIHRVFTGNKYKFHEIWVYDAPDVDEEPYFMIINKAFTKVALINFKTPTYHSKGIYKKNNVKAKGWVLDKEDIDALMSFLKAPSNRADSDYCMGAYKKYVKTNWQQLIFEYNRNTAYWECNEPIVGKIEGEIEQLPFDLPMPDYTKLNEETEEISDYVKELIKPENLIGPFDSTEEMLKSLWDEEK